MGALQAVVCERKNDGRTCKGRSKNNKGFTRASKGTEPFGKRLERILVCTYIQN